MRPVCIPALALALVGALASAPALAATCSVTVCAELEADYLDVGGSDDLYTDDDAKPARGVNMGITTSAGAVLLGCGAEWLDQEALDPSAGR